MRTNIKIDDNLMNEAFRVSNLQTKTEIVHQAIKEFIQKRKKKDLSELAGKITFFEDYDYKTMRQEK